MDCSIHAANLQSLPYIFAYKPRFFGQFFYLRIVRDAAGIKIEIYLIKSNTKKTNVRIL